MRTFSKKKKLPRLLTLCGAVAVSALLGAVSYTHLTLPTICSV